VSPSSPLVVQAPAKLNLALTILGKRDDGYHEIDSVFQAISLCDEITLRELNGAGRVALRCHGPVAVPDGEGNLAWRAARIYLDESGAGSGLEISLYKRIPVGAGLGGGSSDAAAVLIGLEALSTRKLGRERLHDLAARLGSDVPFFLHGGTARCRGRGERVDPLPDPPATFFVVLVPDVQVATAHVYKNFISGLTGGDARASLGAEVARFLITKDIGHFFWNDLEATVVRLFPSVRACRDAFRNLAHPHRVLLTGSGGALFAPCPSAVEAERLGEKVQRIDRGKTYVVHSSPGQRPEVRKDV